MWEARLTRAKLSDLEHAGQGARGRPKSVKAVLELWSATELLAAANYRQRVTNARGPADQVGHEELLADATLKLHHIAERRPDPQGKLSFRQLWDQAWLRHVSVMVFTVCSFWALFLVGFELGRLQPEYASLIAGPDLVEKIIDQEAWFHRINENNFKAFIDITLHNMGLAIKMFFWGTLLGVGGFLLAGFNGLYFGVVLGFCLRHDFEQQLLAFVGAHGPLELSIIAVAAMAGVPFGRAIFAGRVQRPLQLRLATRDGAVIAMGAIPWLVIAGAIEAFISPREHIPVEVKSSLGFGVAALFWVWCLYRADSKSNAVGASSFPALRPSVRAGS